MFKSLYTLLLILLAHQVLGQKTVRVYFDQKQFYNAEIGNYTELYFQFVGHTVKYQATENGLQGTLGVNISIFSKDSLMIKDGYRLDTPIFKDSIIEDFYDLRRYALQPGKYDLKLTLFDAHSDADDVSFETALYIDEYDQTISISDIEIAEFAKKSNVESPFNKSGYEIIPRLSNYYPQELSIIPIYFEVYNTHLMDDSIFGLKQTLIDSESKSEVTGFTYLVKYAKTEVIPVFNTLDISNLPSGSYELKYTILTTGLKELSVNSYQFDRSNNIEREVDPSQIILDPNFQASLSKDSVGFYLESLIPISKPAEVRNILKVSKTKDEENMRKLIQAFWTKTTPNNPYEGWMKYKEQVQLVERIYRNNFQEGFETDRGRVYLQYGAPTNIITKEVSSTEYPYEIWQYNKIEKFSNKRFVFYNPDLTNNAYRLLHSDMIGELKNPSWPQMLSKRNTPNGSIDNPNDALQNSFGNQSNDFFRQY